MNILIISFIFLIVNCHESNHTSKNSETVLKPEYKKDRIEDENNILDKESFSEIKEIIEKNFPLLLIRILTGNEKDINKQPSFFDASSFNHFSKECKNYKDMCDYGYSLDIYVTNKLLFIQIGKESKKIIDDIYKQRMIDSIRYELENENWSHVIKKILIFINYRQKGGKIKAFPKNNDWAQIYILTILTPSFLVGVLFLSFVLYFGSKNFIFCSEVKDFFDGAIKHWNEINEQQNVSEKRIQLTKRECLFCWKESRGNEYFMHCGHSYHEKCLRQWRLYQYGCCPCSYEAYDDKEDEKACLSRPVYLNSEDIKILLGLCLDAFRKENIYDYFIENKKKFDEVNLEDLCWINQKKFENYSSYRIFYKIFKVIKLACVFVTFYPKFLKSKKVKLIERLMKMKNKGFFGG